MIQENLNSDSHSIDQGELIKYEVKKYLRYWLWFVIGIIIALSLAFIYLRYTTSIYSSSAKIQILNKDKGIEMPSSAFIFNKSTINLENEIEVVKSSRISERVVGNLDLTMTYYEVGNLRTTEIDEFPFNVLKTIINDSITSYQSFKIVIKDNGFEVYSGESEKGTIFPNYSSYNVTHDFPFEVEAASLNSIKQSKGKTFILTFTPVTVAARNLKNNLNVSPYGKTSDLLQLNFTSKSKLKAERVLNEVLSVYNKDGISDRQEVSKRTILFIDDRFNLLAGELDSIEGNKRDYKQDNNFFDIGSDAQLGISQRTLSENEVFAIEGQILLSNMLTESLNIKSNKYELLPANIGISSVNTNELISTYNALIFERDNYLTSGGENNPIVQTLSEKLEELAKNINVSLTTYKAQLQASKSQLDKRNDKFSSQVSTIPAKEKMMRSIDRQQTIKESLYLFLLQKREEAGINLAITEPSIKVVEYALASNTPISPNSTNVYLMALVGGLLIPFGVLYLTMMLDTKVKDKKDVELRVPNIPVLAELPQIKGDSLLFLEPSDRSPQAEAFRILSANVNYVLPGNSKKGKVIYVTSTIKGEGKTYTGLNLSLSLSSINKKVLLIGSDLRNPQIHRYTQPEMDKNAPGLSNYLHDETFDWRKALVKGFPKHPDHDILLSGAIPPNPAHLLTNGRFEQLLQDAKEVYDYIIVDTAPTILVTDTLLISEFADVTLYVVRADVTEKNLLDYSKNLMHTGRLKNMAYVINSVGASRAYGYSYNYGYGYGYGEKD